MGIKIISKNRKAFHNFEIGDSFEAGIALLGTEVKALRAAKINMTDGWIDISDGQAWLKDTHIGHYDFGNRQNHDETRPRRLLLKKAEIARLNRSIAEKGFSVIPIKFYFKKSYIKVEIALGKGKKLHDKRDSSKKKDAQREMARAVKSR
tara:strand:- start:1 stop:450 length:450 start_codon:yes stop_codon:yes gene_type:complete